MIHRTVWWLNVLSVCSIIDLWSFLDMNILCESDSNRERKNMSARTDVNARLVISLFLYEWKFRAWNMCIWKYSVFLPHSYVRDIQNECTVSLVTFFRRMMEAFTASERIYTLIQNKSLITDALLFLFFSFWRCQGGWWGHDAVTIQLYVEIHTTCCHSSLNETKNSCSMRPQCPWNWRQKTEILVLPCVCVDSWFWRWQSHNLCVSNR